MNYMKRAWLSVTRKRGKSAILFAVILILGNVIAGAIAVNQSTQNVEKQIKNQLGSFATIEIDYEKLANSDGSASMEDIQSFPEELIKQIGERSEVKQYDYLREASIAVENFKPYRFSSKEDDDNVMIVGGMLSLIHLAGTNLLKPLDFEEDTVNLTQGRFFNEEEQRTGKRVGLISEELAQENGLTVGDTMVLDGQFVDYSSGMDPEKQKGNDYPIEIVGIFKNTSLEKADKKDDDPSSSFFDESPFNRIYMPNDAVKTIVEEERAGQQAAFPATDFGSDEEFFTPQFILNQPEDAEQFKQEVTPLLPNGYKVNASTDEYDRVGTSMNRLSQISSYVVVIAVIASLIIISLIIVLFTRDRKYELGIYLSLGERRKYVFAQIVLELLLIGISAMLISLVTGNMLGKMVSESLLSSSMLEANQAGVEQFFVGVPKIDQATINEAFRVQYTLSYIIAFLATGIVTILLSAVVPLLYILRLNPKKIML
ncbi:MULTISPECIES: ABC transporter permease [Enterococcus]|uniref:ABC transporter permease n=1 Tax=Enterococcus TaxID=1350 RepID=UPI001C8C209D|nr:MULTISPECIES: ABC transporter permease [Enterococcus]